MNSLSDYQREVLESLEKDYLLDSETLSDIVAALAVGSSVEKRLLWEAISEMYRSKVHLDVYQRRIEENAHKARIVSAGVIQNYCKKAVE